MSISFNLYRNPNDGNKLLGAYPNGDKPAVSWQFPTANYVSTNMPMNLVFPRPEAASWSYAKNAYTGVKWNIPIGVQGGAWPFHYEITNNGGATGLTIGNFLLGVIDGPTGKTTYTVGDDYGVLSWDTPVAGSYSITVRVTDQTGATLDVAVSLTVGTSGWLFVDPVNGNDSTGDGSIGNPFASLVPLHNDSNLTTTYANHRVYLRSGVTPLGGMSTSTNHYSIQNNAVPAQYIGYPNESPVLECDIGRFSLSAAEDFMLRDIEFRYKSTYLPSGEPLYMFAAFGATNRLTLHNVHFSNFDGSAVNTGNGNTSILFLNGTDRSHLYIGRCRQTGVTGMLTSAYQVTNGLVEHHKVNNATITTADGSVHAIVYLKDDPVNFTVRNVEVWENTTPSDLAGVSIGGQDGAQNVEICYCTCKSSEDPSLDRGGAIYMWQNNPVSALVDNIYVYRNSVEIGIEWEGGAHTNMADGTEKHIKNISNGGAEVVTTKVVNTDNLANATYLDANMKLTGANRTTYLGTHGAEVAQ